MAIPCRSRLQPSPSKFQGREHSTRCLPHSILFHRADFIPASAPVPNFPGHAFLLRQAEPVMNMFGSCTVGLLQIISRWHVGQLGIGARGHCLMLGETAF